MTLGGAINTSQTENRPRQLMQATVLADVRRHSCGMTAGLRVKETAQTVETVGVLLFLCPKPLHNVLVVSMVSCVSCVCVVFHIRNILTSQPLCQ